jgi:diguanylate cyclase (GGDEF)-like protein/PAS domain S-box-containing protein
MERDLILDGVSCCRLLDDLFEGLYVVDSNRRIVFWNRAAEKITGFTAAEVTGSSCSDSILNHVDAKGRNLCAGTCPLAQTLADGVHREADVFLHHRDGHRVPVSIRISPVTDSSGNVIGSVELFSDSSRRAAIESRIRELEEMAFLDDLTRIANRNRLESEITERLSRTGNVGRGFGLLFMDIDDFKSFNDTYGHDTGDQVLKSLAGTLTVNARPSDFVGRWGGDEFAVIVDGCSLESLAAVGNRLRMLIGASYVRAGELSLRTTVSIGATVPLPGDTLESVIKRADGLLYESKRSGKDRLCSG